MTLRDERDRYGWVSRWLHWGIATLLAWQFLGMALKLILGRVPIMAIWVGSHASVGTLLLLLIMARIGWAFSQRWRRPPHGHGPIGQLARAGHVALYALMLIVPLLAMLRMIGGTCPIRLFGVDLRGPAADEIAAMTAPGDLLHGLLAWGLLALIAGHVVMVLVHRFIWRDDTLARMAGGRRTDHGIRTSGPLPSSRKRVE